MKAYGARADRRPRAAEWRRRVRKLLRDGGGVWSAEIIRVDDFSDVAKLMLDPVRAGLFADWITAVAQAVRDDAPICLDCDPEIGLVTGICAECAARSDSELMAVARRRLKSIWPDLRPLPPENFVRSGGRA
jgi:hypothetical protein